MYGRTKESKSRKSVMLMMDDDEVEGLEIDGREGRRERERTSSFSIVASAINRTSSWTSKENMGPDFPRYLFTMKSSVFGS